MNKKKELRSKGEAGEGCWVLKTMANCQIQGRQTDERPRRATVTSIDGSSSIICFGFSLK